MKEKRVGIKIITYFWTTKLGELPAGTFGWEQGWIDVQCGGRRSGQMMFKGAERRKIVELRALEKARAFLIAPK